MDETYDILILWTDKAHMLSLTHSLKIQGQKIILNFVLSKGYMCHLGIITSFNCVGAR